MCIRLWHVPKISRKFVGEWNFVLLCYSHDENRTGYHPALVQLFRGIFLQGSWRTLSREAKERDAKAVDASLLFPFLCIGMISLPTIRCPCKPPCHLTRTESAKPSGVLSSHNSLSNLSQSALSSDLAAPSESLFMHSSTEAFMCAKLKHPA